MTNLQQGTDVIFGLSEIVAVESVGIILFMDQAKSLIKGKAQNLDTDSIDEFISLYEEHRFGGRDMIGKERARYQMLLKELKRQIKS